MQNIDKEELIEILYSELISKISSEIDIRIEEKITEILYSPILEDKEWPRKKRT